jgi:hypothetical protein
MVNVRSGIDQSAYIFGKVASSPRKETVLDHLMHCVAGPGYDPEQCVEGQTPDFPAGVSTTTAPYCTAYYLTAATGCRLPRHKRAVAAVPGEHSLALVITVVLIRSNLV